MCVKNFGPYRTSQVSGSTSATFVPMTPWLAALSATKIKSLIKLSNRTSEFDIQLAIQTASVDTDSPDSASGKGSVISSNSTTCSGEVDISTDVSSKFFVRVGVLVVNGTGTALERGDIEFAVSVSGA